MALPPWLQINPETFSGAIQSGASLGQRIAQMRQEAGMQADRLASSERENSARLINQSQIASQNQELRKNEFEAERARLAWEQSQKMDLANQKLQDQSAYQSGRLELGNRRVDQNFDLGNRRLDQAAELAGDKLDQAGQFHKDKMDLEGDKFNAPLYKVINGSLIQIDPSTGLPKTLLSVPSQHTGKVSQLDALLNGDGGGQSPSSGTGLTPGQKVRNKKTGEMGTVDADGNVVPDAPLGGGFQF